jgi:hypothetical protein
MRTYLLLLCLTGLLLKSFTGRSQHLQRPYSIQLSAHNSTSGTDFRVNVTRRVDAIYLRYGRLDSMQNGRLRADPRYGSYVSELQANPLPTAAGTSTVKRLLALVEQYKVYRWDSLRVVTRRHQPFGQLLDSVYSSSAAQLERRAANRDRIVLDGTSVHVVVQTGTQIEKDLYINAPSLASHPLLYRVLHEALQLYRQEYPTSFLDQRFTSGY